MHACMEGARQNLTTGGRELRVVLLELGQEGSDSMLHLNLSQGRKVPSLSSDLLQRRKPAATFLKSQHHTNTANIHNSISTGVHEGLQSKGIP